LNEKFEGDDFEGVFVGGFEDDGTGGSRLLDLKPSCGTDAPAVAGLEAGESILRHRGNEVVAEGAGGFEEGLIDDTTDGVDAEIVGAGVAAAVAVEAGGRITWLATAGGQGLAEDVASRGLSGLDGRHGFLRVLSYSFSVVGSILNSRRERKENTQLRNVELLCG
jgi:hypothetical protein